MTSPQFQLNKNRPRKATYPSAAAIAFLTLGVLVLQNQKPASFSASNTRAEEKQPVTATEQGVVEVTPQTDTSSAPESSRADPQHGIIATGFAQHISAFVQLQRDESTRRLCPCCGWSGSVFDTVPWGKRRKDGLCPQCQSCERHRRTCALLGSRPDLLQQSVGGNSTTSVFRLLHFGPHKQMDKMINQVEPRVDQVGLDYFADDYKNLYSGSTLHGDVQNLQLPTNFANGIIILHVMEHVPELEKAFAELKRVLAEKNGATKEGWMVVEVPFLSRNGQQTADCRGAKSGSERYKCAGQSDHVWAFAQGDFERRLKEAGWDCENSEGVTRKALGDNALVDSFKLNSPALPSLQYFCHVAATTTPA